MLYKNTGWTQIHYSELRSSPTLDIPDLGPCVCVQHTTSTILLSSTQTTGRPPDVKENDLSDQAT